MYLCNLFPYSPRLLEPWISSEHSFLDSGLILSLLALFLNHSLVLVMCSNPEPNQSFGDFDRKCTIVKTNSHRAVFANFFEVQGGMSKV
jgi:hypothetical protein